MTEIKQIKQKCNRATYKGFIQFGLVNIGCKGYNAVATDTKTRFNSISPCCKHRITQKRFCSSCDKEVQYSELLKGYELDKKSNQYVILDKEEIDTFANARSNMTRNITLYLTSDRNSFIICSIRL